MKYQSFNIFLLLIVLSFFSCDSFNRESTWQVKDGILNLTRWLPEDNGPVELYGNWEFYYNQLLEPKDFKNGSIRKDRFLMKVPQSWQKGGNESTEFKAYGYATYKLTIKLNNPKEEYSLKFTTISCAYKLWINDRLLTTVGNINNTPEKTKPCYISKLIPFHVEPRFIKNDKAEIQIVMQVANFHHLRAGIWKPAWFGTADQLLHNDRDRYATDLIIMGIVLVIGIYHLFLYMFRRNDYTLLSFGVLCLIMMIRSLSTGERYLTFWFPDMNWEFLVKLDNFSGFGTIPLFALFIYNLFRADMPKIMMRIIVIFGICITVLVAATNTLFYGQFRIIFEVYVLISGIYLCFFVLLKSVIRKRKGSFFAFIGFFILLATAINDVFVSMELIYTTEIAPYGIAFYMFSQSFILAQRSADAFTQSEKLTLELNNQTQNLGNTLEKHKEEISKQKEELVHKRGLEQQQNWINEGLATFGSILTDNRENIDMLSNAIIKELVKYIKVNQGCIMILNDSGEEPYLELVASYAMDKRKIENKKIMVNEGLAGAAFKEKRTYYINNIPEDYIKLESGFGYSSPRFLLLVPLVSDDNPLGVIELASLKEIPPYKIEFTERLANIIVASIYAIFNNSKNQNLLIEFREQAEKLQAQEEQMRYTIETLNKTQDEYLNREVVLSGEIQELKKKITTLEAENKEFREQI